MSHSAFVAPSATCPSPEDTAAAATIDGAHHRALKLPILQYLLNHLFLYLQGVLCVHIYVGTMNEGRKLGSRVESPT